MQLVDGTPSLVQAVPFLLFFNLILALNWLMFSAIARRAGRVSCSPIP